MAKKLIFFLTLFSLCLSALFALEKGKSYFPLITDLVETGQLNKGKLIVVLVSQEGCLPCKQLADKVLLPIEAAGTFKGRVVFKEIDLGGEIKLPSSDNKSVSARSFVSEFAEPMSPLLLFLDSQGNSVHEPMAGIGPADYYGFYVEQAIEEGLSNLARRS